MRGTLTFQDPAGVIDDHERPGVLRAVSVLGEVRQLELHDLADLDVAEPHLLDAGFEMVDLSANEALQRALGDVRRSDHLSTDAIDDIRDSLTGEVLELENGASLRIDLIVDDGLFHRRSGPNGLNVNPDGIRGPNGHNGADQVHGDQDVFGTPLRQLMDGGAPRFFRHVSPDGRNDEATVCLLNLWIPLVAPVQPLALMDRRTLDAQRHQLRYGLPVDGFLDRDDDAVVNDIWKFLYDDAQRWFVRTDMGPGQGYVFDTLGTAHGAAVLPGEDLLERLYLALEHRCAVLEAGDADVPADVGSRSLPVDAPLSIRGSAERMSALLDAAPDRDAAGGGAIAGWCADARLAMSGVIRRSIEMRLMATLHVE